MTPTESSESLVASAQNKHLRCQKARCSVYQLTEIDVKITENCKVTCEFRPQALLHAGRCAVSVREAHPDK